MVRDNGTSFNRWRVCVSRLSMVSVLLAASFLYLHGLGEAPIHISTDEARFAVQAQSIASTGRDIQGNRMPLFFLITDPLIANHSSVAWWQPELFYLMAGVFTVVPLSEWSARLPIACLAILNVWLIYLVGRELFSNTWYAVGAALLLALTPAHFIMGRQAADYFLPLPFALAWLWSLLRCRRSPSAWTAGAAGLILGAGLYSYITSWMVMPFYLVLSLAVLQRSRKPLRFHAALAAGFALPLLPLAAWLWSHPAMPGEVFTNYNRVSGARLSERVSIYWDYFNPSYLFFSGGSNLMWGTRRAGVFPIAVAVLLPCGLWASSRRPISIARLLPVIGFFFAAVPIVVALPEAPQYATARHLLVVPFGVLISIAGLEWLAGQSGWLPRLAVAALLVSVPLQFAGFARDYFADYQVRSSFWSDSMNVRAVAAYVVSSDAAGRVPAVYLSEEDLGEDKTVKFRFHLLAMHRFDLWDRTRYFSAGRTANDDIPAGSLLVLLPGSPRVPGLLGSGWERAATVNSVAGEPAAAILRRR